MTSKRHPLRDELLCPPTTCKLFPIWGKSQFPQNYPYERQDGSALETILPNQRVSFRVVYLIHLSAKLCRRPISHFSRGDLVMAPIVWLAHTKIIETGHAHDVPRHGNAALTFSCTEKLAVGRDYVIVRALVASDIIAW